MKISRWRCHAPTRSIPRTALVIVLPPSRTLTTLFHKECTGWLGELRGDYAVAAADTASVALAAASAASPAAASAVAAYPNWSVGFCTPIARALVSLCLLLVLAAVLFLSYPFCLSFLLLAHSCLLSLSFSFCILRAVPLVFAELAQS